MRPLHWRKLPVGRIAKTVWASIAAKPPAMPPLPAESGWESVLEQRFAQPKPAAHRQTNGGAAAEGAPAADGTRAKRAPMRLRVSSMQRATNVGVFLHTLERSRGLSAHRLITALRSLDEEVLQAEVLESLLPMLPTEQEAAACSLLLAQKLDELQAQQGTQPAKPRAARSRAAGAAPAATDELPLTAAPADAPPAAVAPAAAEAPAAAPAAEGAPGAASAADAARAAAAAQRAREVAALEERASALVASELNQAEAFLFELSRLPRVAHMCAPAARLTGAAAAVLPSPRRLLPVLLPPLLPSLLLPCSPLAAYRTCRLSALSRRPLPRLPQGMRTAAPADTARGDARGARRRGAYGAHVRRGLSLCGAALVAECAADCGQLCEQRLRARDGERRAPRCARQGEALLLR